MKYTSFRTLCEDLNGLFPSPQIGIVHHADGKHIGINLVKCYFPVSINESEFNYMFNFIVDHDLKSGFELSTGTGISTIAIGSALKETGGHLISMDSYYEELNGISHLIPVGNYTPENIVETKDKSECYKFISQTIPLIGLEQTVQLEIGWSPVDSVASIAKRGTPLDIVFLDCPKNDDEFERDFRSILPHLNKEKFAIFVHDTHCYQPKSFNLVKELLGLEMVCKYEYFPDTLDHSKRHLPLGVITNIKE